MWDLQGSGISDEKHGWLENEPFLYFNYGLWCIYIYVKATTPVLHAQGSFNVACSLRRLEGVKTLRRLHVPCPKGAERSIVALRGEA